MPLLNVANQPAVGATKTGPIYTVCKKLKTNTTWPGLDRSARRSRTCNRVPLRSARTPVSLAIHLHQHERPNRRRWDRAQHVAWCAA